MYAQSITSSWCLGVFMEACMQSFKIVLQRPSLYPISSDMYICMCNSVQWYAMSCPASNSESDGFNINAKENNSANQGLVILSEILDKLKWVWKKTYDNIPWCGQSRSETSLYQKNRSILQLFSGASWFVPKKSRYNRTHTCKCKSVDWWISKSIYTHCEQIK